MKSVNKQSLIKDCLYTEYILNIYWVLTEFKQTGYGQNIEQTHSKIKYF